MAKKSKKELDFIDNLSCGVDLHNRQLYVIGIIDSATAHKFIASLKLIDKTKGDINIMINSPGGEEASGFGMYDALKMTKNKTVASVYGEASSIAAVVLQGAKVRKMTEHSTILIHNGIMKMQKESLQDYVENMAKNIKVINEMYYSILSNKDFYKMQAFYELGRKETLFTAKEALTFGLIDEII